MCGIFGILQHRPGQTPDLERLELTARLLQHRGPDHRAVFSDDGIGLAQTRLALVDLNPRSNQPFWDRTGRYCLVYNGEIYDFRELRAELEAEGVVFRTTSDTEVVLEALIRRGWDATVPRLEGMFAFGFYDTRNRSLVLARDRFGIKPLYIYDGEDAFLFSSEIPAMRPWIPFEPDLLSISAYLQGFGGPTSGFSFYKGVRIVPSGTVVTVARGERSDSRVFWPLERFWDPGEAERLREMRPGQIVDEVEERLVKSVEMQLLADAPVGVLCSGGVDSSVITAIAARLHKDLAIFHADVVGPFSERAAAAALAKHLGLDLKAVPVADADSLETMPEVMLHYGHPFIYHPNSVPFLMVSKLVRSNGVKGILSGEGADESYIGYPWLIFDLRKFVLQSPRTVPRGAYRLLHAAISRALRRPVTRPLEECQWLIRGLHTRFEIETEEERIRAEVKRKMGRDPKPRDLVTLYQLGYHLRTLLHRNDALGMAASIEARFPFLDTKLVRLAVNMPYNLKVRLSPTTLERGHLFLRDKWVLRKVAERYLPPALSKRQKRGFPIGVAARMYIAPELFEKSFVANLLELGTSEARFLFEEATRQLRLRLLHLDVWGRVCLEGISLEEERARLQKYVSLQTPR
jgi:asparagine synthase (glutamine-hydrolysing)